MATGLDNLGAQGRWLDRSSVQALKRCTPIASCRSREHRAGEPLPLMGAPTSSSGCGVVIGAPYGGLWDTREYRGLYRERGSQGLPQAYQLLPRSFHSVTRNEGRRVFRRSAMGRKPLGDRALSPAERQSRWRLRHPTDSRRRRQIQATRTDDFAERQAVVWEYNWLIEELAAVP